MTHRKTNCAQNRFIFIVYFLYVNACLPLLKVPNNNSTSISRGVQIEAKLEQNGRRPISAVPGRWFFPIFGSANIGCAVNHIVCFISVRRTRQTLILFFDQYNSRHTWCYIRSDDHVAHGHYILCRVY